MTSDYKLLTDIPTAQEVARRLERRVSALETANTRTTSASASVVVAPPLSKSGSTISLAPANSLAGGYLSPTDWRAFNAKQDAITTPTKTTMTLTNSWASTAGWEAASYYKDVTGRVHLSGVVDTGTVGLAIATLPTGYRPAAKERFMVLSNGAAGELTVGTDGAVILVTGSNVYVTLSGVSYLAV